MPKFTHEKLPSGIICKKFGQNFLLIDDDCATVVLTEKDIDRLQGIIHPEKVHGKWTGDCGGRPETAFEKAIKEAVNISKQAPLKSDNTE